MGTVYVTGHRNPDTDSIASAIGYAELKGRLDPRNEYVPVRLGDLNSQTRWVLDRSAAPEPELLPHVLLRVGDVMLEGFPTVSHREPIRQVGLMMARQDLELIPIVDDDGARAGAPRGSKRAAPPPPPLHPRVARRAEPRRRGRDRCGSRRPARRRARQR